MVDALEDFQDLHETDRWELELNPVCLPAQVKRGLGPKT